MDIAKRKEELLAELKKANETIEQATNVAYRLQGAIMMCDEMAKSEVPAVEDAVVEDEPK